MWIARWDSNSALTGWSGIPDSQWSDHQRGKQYRGDHNETYGGVTINIDSDRFDAPVATVGYSYRVTSAHGSQRAQRADNLGIDRQDLSLAGSTLKVVCQTPGSTVGSTAVWNKLSDGNYVSDYYVSTPSQTTYSAPLPRCTYPYQVTVVDTERTDWAGLQLCDRADIIEWCARLDLLPAVRTSGEQHHSLGSARRHVLRLRLLRRNAQQDLL